ncbi:MAG: hypothetical protein VX777_09235 [Chlamydiota bacterium]|nr:hypothetical protein [Chlamydiota bacterium]
MKLLKFILPLVAIMNFAQPVVHADDVRCDASDISQYDQDLNERDWDALYDYINTKRTINVNEKSCNLTLSGDVRVDWRHRCEKDNGRRLRGGNAVNAAGKAVGRNDFDAEFNLRFDYVCDRAWSVAHLAFDNGAGVANDHSCKNDPEGLHGSGSGCDVDLKKAYLGYNLLCDGCTRFDLEVGRRRLYQVFYSEVQFLSRFDGALLKYDSCFDCVGDYYVRLGGFIVDYTCNHYAWVIEGGLNDVMDTSIDVKYSFIDWRKNGTNRCGVKNPVGADFMNSQVSLVYNFEPDYLCVPANVFGAFLINHDASKETVSSEGNIDSKANCAWFAGFTVGEVVRRGDYAFKAQYQWVEAKSIPDDDVSGIGNGNVQHNSFTNGGKGNTNFKGFRLEALYAFTDNITMDVKAAWSRQIDKDFGGKHSFSQVKCEVIYAF